MWFPDSFGYLTTAQHPVAGVIRPSGYPLFLWALRPLHSLALITGLQHAMGLGIGVMIYALLRRNRVPAWGATLAAVPMLFVVFLLARRVTWRPVAAAVTACALPVAAYAGWFTAGGHDVGLNGSTGIFLYSRMTPFADCTRIHPPASERPLRIPQAPVVAPPSEAAQRIRAYGHASASKRVVQPYAGALRTYQRYVYLPGAQFGLIILVGLAGIIRRRRRLGGRASLPLGVAMALIVIPPVTVEFDYRYVLPTVAPACVAAALAVRHLRSAPRRAG